MAHYNGLPGVIENDILPRILFALKSMISCVCLVSRAGIVLLGNYIGECYRFQYSNNINESKKNIAL